MAGKFRLPDVFFERMDSEYNPIPYPAGPFGHKKGKSLVSILASCYMQEEMTEKKN